VNPDARPIDGPAGRAPRERRLFVGLWPDAAAARALAAWRSAWRWPPGARLTPDDQWHVTLHFLGAVPQDDVARLVDALAQVAVPTGACVSLERPALWHGGIAVLEPAEDAGIPGPLARLHADLGDALAGAGRALETRPWRPHVTLARHAGGATPPEVAPPAARWRVGAFVLAQSAGGRYTALRAF
jgi:2'-5' RNA ligase